MRRFVPSDAYKKVMFTQAGLILGLCFIALMASGQGAALSTLVGGSAVLMSTAAYAWLVRKSRVTGTSGRVVLFRHLIAEFAKIAIVLGVIFGAFASGLFVASWLIAAMVVALMGHWLSVFLIR